MKLRVCLLLLLSLLSFSTLIEDMDQDIGEAIFHNGEYYLIHVYNQIQKEYFVPFRQYCNLPETKCTTMNPKVQQYQQFTQFIGAHKPSYFLIIDAPTRKKYIMEDVEITVESIKQFVDSYHSKTLQPYVSSEQLPTQDSKFVTKLVGKTIFDFIHKNRDNYKVILFTSDNTEICENCPQILTDFKELGQKMQSQNREFGHIDLVKNQHPEINQEVIPVVAVYKGGEQLHVFTKFFVADLEQKIYKIERGEVIEEEESSEDDYHQGGNYEYQGEQVQYQGQEVQSEL